jgi:spermidine synthase
MDRSLKRAIIFSSIILGMTSIVAQIVILRELLVIFYGNELSIGLVLASWLIWVAVGAWAFGGLVEQAARRPLVLPVIQVLVSILVPTLIFLARTVKNILGLSPGEIVGIAPMLLCSCIVLAPLCLMLGFTFSLLCESYQRPEVRDQSGKTGAGRIGSVYVLEAVGSVLGGLAFSLALIKLLNPMQAGFMLTALNLVAALFSTRATRLRFVPSVLLVLCIIAMLLGATQKLESLAVRQRWRNFNLEFNGNSIYGNVAVLSLGNEKAFYESGYLAFSTGDEQSSEETAHIPLLAHPDPKTVLLIGGTVSGTLKEVLKHPVESVTCVELDPMIVSAAKEVLRGGAAESLLDPRVSVVFDDGRRFVRLSKNRYDVMISSLPDPLNALVNRFYSAEYFREVKRALNTGGILSIGVTSSENYLNPEQQKFMACIYGTLKSVFEHVLIVPGDRTYFLSSDDPGLESVSAQSILQEETALGIHTDFITEGYLSDRMDPARMDFVLSSIKRTGLFSINTDLKPAGYFYDTVTWLTRFHSRSSAVLSRISSIQPLWHLLPFCILFVGFLIPALTRRKSNSPIIAAVLTTGYSTMVLQVVIMFCFQVFFGYLYYRLGLILTSFMIGLALGASLMNANAGRVSDSKLLFLRIQILLAVYPVFLAVCFLFLARGAHLGQIMFGILPAVAGLLGGAQFPLAAKIALTRSNSIGRVAGYLYGIDLLGSCVGAVLASAVLIPILGVVGTCLLVFVANSAALFVILLSEVRQRLAP